MSICKLPNITALSNILGAILIVGFVATITTSVIAIDELKVGGPIFQRISLGKDLVADILPPPEYIIEAYLEVNLATSDTANLDVHRQRLMQLHKERLCCRRQRG